MKEPSTNWRFWLFWVLAFFSFPIAGLLAIFVVPVDTPVRALIAGAIAGAALSLDEQGGVRTRNARHDRENLAHGGRG